MYDDILVPTDGGDRMDEVTTHAVDLAERHDATVHAISVIDKGTFLTLDEHLKGAVEEELAEEAETAIAAVADAAADAGLEAETVVRRGKPGEEIRRYADANGIDAVVMGSRGSKSYEKQMLGSVSQNVVTNADCPTLVVPLR